MKTRWDENFLRHGDASNDDDDGCDIEGGGARPSKKNMKNLFSFRVCGWRGWKNISFAFFFYLKLFYCIKIAIMRF